MARSAPVRTLASTVLEWPLNQPGCTYTRLWTKSDRPPSSRIIPVPFVPPGLRFEHLVRDRADLIATSFPNPAVRRLPRQGTSTLGFCSRNSTEISNWQGAATTDGFQVRGLGIPCSTHDYGANTLFVLGLTGANTNQRRRWPGRGCVPQDSLRRELLGPVHSRGCDCRFGSKNLHSEDRVPGCEFPPGGNRVARTLLNFRDSGTYSTHIEGSRSSSGPLDNCRQDWPAEIPAEGVQRPKHEPIDALEPDGQGSGPCRPKGVPSRLGVPPYGPQHQLCSNGRSIRQDGIAHNSWASFGTAVPVSVSLFLPIDELLPGRGRSVVSRRCAYTRLWTKSDQPPSSRIVHVPFVPPGLRLEHLVRDRADLIATSFPSPAVRRLPRQGTSTRGFCSRNSTEISNWQGATTTDGFQVRGLGIPCSIHDYGANTLFVLGLTGANTNQRRRWPGRGRVPRDSLRKELLGPVHSRGCDCRFGSENLHSEAKNACLSQGWGSIFILPMWGNSSSLQGGVSV
ncbi:hypothetical protein R1flu_016682 [Riccia fluitans]|uniref:Uncharacterized protein n=1 Tax=Riccia fluitans TaxID=41844 RepID=A0ABD1YMJ1_9MARC